MEEIIISSKYDEYPIYATLYTVSNPKGIIQIIHGMKEHQLRYKAFAEFLNKNGYIVLTSDMRGHGKNASLLGHMESRKSWEALILDQVSLSDYLKTNYPSLNLYLFAHSMGTIVARNLIQKHSDFYTKIILSGVPAYQNGVVLGIPLLNIISLFKGNKYVSNMITSLTDGSFIKAIENPKTNVDWLSYNEDNINNYLNDKYCNIPFSISAYKALYHLLWGMNKANRYYVLEPVKPILFIVGKDDPCTLGNKGLNNSIKILKKAGYNNIKLNVYDNMRHEILNETSFNIVYDDIINFLN